MDLCDSANVIEELNQEFIELQNKYQQLEEENKKLKEKMIYPNGLRDGKICLPKYDWDVWCGYLNDEEVQKEMEWFDKRIKRTARYKLKKWSGKKYFIPCYPFLSARP